MFVHDIQADQIPPDLRRAVFRIVQESLANACRHSKGNRLFAEMTLDGDVLRIQIQDWGVGLERDRTAPARSGLDGTRQPLGLLRGTATIHRQPGKGTCVTVELPLAP